MTAIVQDRIGFILVGTERGLYRYDSVGFTPAAGVPAAQRVDGMHTDHDGRTWAALGGSLYASIGGGFSKVASAQPIPIEASHRLAMLGGDIVVSTGGTVLRASLNPQRVGAFSPFFSPALLSITPALKRPSFLAADGTSLLIGCGDGVCRADAGHIEVFDQRVGLPADAWQVAIRSRDGTLWVRSLDRLAWQSPGAATWAMYEDIDGSMWFGTSRGLSHLLAPALLPTEMTLHPLITRVTLGERALDVRSPLHLDWSREPLIVSFAALDFKHERNIQLRYRMLGVDAGWNNTSAHEVRYAGLPVGRLAFEVSAFDPVHGGVSMPTALVIKIRAPWWLRWWCYALEGLAVCLVVVGAWQLRIRLLLRGQRLLEQMVQDRTREIEQARRELLLQATSDSLTGLSNHRAIMT